MGELACKPRKHFMPRQAKSNSEARRPPQQFPVPGNKEDVVKASVSYTRVLQGLVLACAVLFAASAFAVNKASFDLQHPTKIAGQELAAGSYKVQWEGTGNEVQLTILRGSKQVATTTAHVVDIKVKSPDTSALVNVNPDGSRSLSQIRFRGKTFALDLGADGAGAGSGGAGK